MKKTLVNIFVLFVVSSSVTLSQQDYWFHAFPMPGDSSGTNLNPADSSVSFYNSYTGYNYQSGDSMNMWYGFAIWDKKLSTLGVSAPDTFLIVISIDSLSQNVSKVFFTIGVALDTTPSSQVWGINYINITDSSFRQQYKEIKFPSQIRGTSFRFISLISQLQSAWQAPDSSNSKFFEVFKIKKLGGIVGNDTTIYDGFGTVTGVLKPIVQTPKKFALGQNYPNPFNPTTQIKYSVPTTELVTLKVCNILGQEVATLFSGVQSAGSHQVTFDGTRLASGVYFYRLQAGNQMLVKKMVMMK